MTFCFFSFCRGAAIRAAFYQLRDRKLSNKIGARQNRVDIILQRQHSSVEGIGLSSTRLEIVNATEHSRCSQNTASFLYFGPCQPDSRDDGIIQFQSFVAAEELSSKNETQELLACLRVNPEIAPDQLAAGDVAASFFECY